MTVKQRRVAFHAELMSAQDVGHSIGFEELVDDARPKRVTRTSWRNGKVLFFGVRVRPNQISDRAFVRYFSETVDDFDLVD